MNDEGKIVITPEELARPDALATDISVGVGSIPLWWRITSVLLILCPPILFVITISGLCRVRHNNMAVRHDRALHYCRLLLASGILWTFLLLILVLWNPQNLIDHSNRPSTLHIDNFPPLPSKSALSGRDVAQQMLAMVVVVHHAEGNLLPVLGSRQSCGAGAVAFAGLDGCLIVTSRHVVDALCRPAQLGKRVGITLKDGQKAEATVAGLHLSLDLALLWAGRDGAQADFAQPLRGFKTVEVGEQVFVIGHPEGLEFSISGGLVAQTRGEDMIQLSAPVSPGNSGGPVYDVHGRLIAIIQSVFDKAKSPNAENLNFAVRADDLLNPETWTLTREGRAAVVALATTNQDIEKDNAELGENDNEQKGD